MIADPKSMTIGIAGGAGVVVLTRRAAVLFLRKKKKVHGSQHQSLCRGGSEALCRLADCDRRRLEARSWPNRQNCRSSSTRQR